MEKALPVQSYRAVFLTLQSYLHNRYHAISMYPDAPYYRINMEHLQTLRYMVKQGLLSTDQKFWAGMIISRGTVSLMAIVTTNKARRDNELKKITTCLDILRIKTGRKAA